MHALDLSIHGIDVESVAHNLSPARLYEEAIRHDDGSAISDTGALIVSSGIKTGRSPKDKRIVRRPETENEVWWGPVNIALDEDTYFINRERAKDYLNTCNRVYVVDGFAGWATSHRLKIRVICSRPYHALFMHTMMIRLTEEELAGFGEPDFTIYNAGPFPANRLTKGMNSTTSVDLSLEDRELVILGTEYAGEMKKGIFTVMHYLSPKRGHLSMHCSATADPQSGRSSVLFGLSGTGKTTLSADPSRQLVGDDEHVWTDDGIYNIEGGCYAKTIDLTPETEPEIFQALHFGAVLENVVFNPENRHVDFRDTSLTQNTRGAYPIEFIRNARIPCIADHPTDIIFLTCDAFGVLPPVAKLNSQQAMYHFISGYTAKVAGTEVGVIEPQATFSACFGAPFLVWHPAKYAQLLAEKMQRHKVNVWLVNTGWSGGIYGTGSRIKLKYTRAIIKAIHSGALALSPTRRDTVFGFEVVMECPEVPSEILWPENTWSDACAYRSMAQRLAGMFSANFEELAGGMTADIRGGGPIPQADQGNP
ncbi:MAG: phosphoenolpyruvate carboxykinase (ATP) [Luteolibacter sp.]